MPDLAGVVEVPEPLRRAVKRLRSAARDFDREAAKYEDRLAEYGISLEIHHSPDDGAQEKNR